jgi:hypothetical protein
LGVRGPRTSSRARGPSFFGWFRRRVAAVASRLDASGIRGSGGDAEARKYPSSQSQISRENHEKPSPVGHGGRLPSIEQRRYPGSPTDCRSLVEACR